MPAMYYQFTLSIVFLNINLVYENFILIKEKKIPIVVIISFRLINVLQPGSIPEKKINNSKMAFKCMENINLFLEQVTRASSCFSFT